MEIDILTIKALQEVQTPYGPGIAVGAIVERDGSIGEILISQDPKKVTLPDELLAGRYPGPCVLLAYPIEQLRVKA